MTDRYGIKEYIKEYRVALEGQPEQVKPKGKPNLLQALRGKKERGKPTWPLT